MQKWLLLALLTVASAASATNVAISPAAAPSLAAASESNTDASADQEGDFSFSIGAGMKAFKANFKGSSVFSSDLTRSPFDGPDFDPSAHRSYHQFFQARRVPPLQSATISKIKRDQNSDLKKISKDFEVNSDKSDKSLNINIAASYKLNLGNGISYQPEIKLGYNFFSKPQSSSINTDEINDPSNRAHINPVILEKIKMLTFLENDGWGKPDLARINARYENLPIVNLSLAANPQALTQNQRQIHVDAQGNLIFFAKTWLQHSYNIDLNFLKFGFNYNGFTFSPYAGLSFGRFKATVTDNALEKLEFSKEEKEKNSDLKHEISGSFFLPGITVGFDVAAPLMKNDMFNLKLGLSAAYTWYKTVDIFSDNFFSPKLTKKFNEKAPEVLGSLSSGSLVGGDIQPSKIKALVSGSEMAPRTWYVGGSLSFEL